MAVILHCDYEELKALRGGARAFLGEGSEEPCLVAAPPESRAQVEALLPRLEGPLTIRTLAEQRAVLAAVDVVLACLRAEMESLVTATHPASEGAVAAYFDFAHALTVRHRVQELGAEMAALIEVMTGGPATLETLETFVFPD